MGIPEGKATSCRSGDRSAKSWIHSADPRATAAGRASRAVERSALRGRSGSASGIAPARSAGANSQAPRTGVGSSHPSRARRCAIILPGVWSPCSSATAGDLLEGDGGFPLQFEVLDERGKRRRDGSGHGVGTRRSVLSELERRRKLSLVSRGVNTGMIVTESVTQGRRVTP